MEIEGDRDDIPQICLAGENITSCYGLKLTELVEPESLRIPHILSGHFGWASSTTLAFYYTTQIQPCLLG